jgi:ABC-type phosphate transport system substrate-binding protein
MSWSSVGRVASAAAIAVALATIPLAGAQGSEGTAQKKPATTGQKKAGGSHSMTGCLQKGSEANMYELTNVEGSGPKTVEIVGTSKGVDLAPHVGHKVTITGTAVNAKAAAKKEGTKDTKEEQGEHHMRISAVKMVSATCP